MKCLMYRSALSVVFFFVFLSAHGTPPVLKLIEDLSFKIHTICIDWSEVRAKTIDRKFDHELSKAIQAIRELLRHDRLLVDATDSFGRTPLMAAAFAGFDTIVALLLQYGASVDRVDARGKSAIDYVIAALSPDDPFSQEIACTQAPFYRRKTHYRCLSIIGAARCFDSPECEAALCA